MVVFSNPLAYTKVKYQPYCFRSPTNGKKGMKSKEGAGEVEGGGLGAAPRHSRDGEFQPAHMSARCTSSHVNKHLPCQQSKQVNLATEARDRYLVPSCFAAYVTDPVVTTAPPPQIQHTCRCITQRGVAWDSLYLC